MKITGDYHTHTPYSHGKSTVIQNVMQAAKMGLKQIAITDHGFSHVLFCVREWKFPNLRYEIEQAGKLVPEIEVLVGLEANIVRNNGKIDIPKKLTHYFDIVVAGYHRAAKMGFVNFFTKTLKWGRKKTNTKMITNALRRNKIDILAHPGRDLKVDIMEVARVCAETDTYFEINESSGKFTPTQLKEIATTGVKFVINSDAHHYAKIGHYPKSIQKAIEAEIEIANADGRKITLKDHKTL